MMRLPKFRYFAPSSVKEALRIKAGEGPDAACVAGGTDLYPNMKRRQQTPKVVIGLSRIAALGRLRVGDGEAAIGAGVPLSAIERHRRMRRAYPGPGARGRGDLDAARCATWARSAGTSCSTRAATTTTRTTSGARRSTSA